MKNVCDICGGIGQIGIFRGLSRFIMTYEECPECYGTGLAQKNGDAKKSTSSVTACPQSHEDSPNKTSS